MASSLLGVGVDYAQISNAAYTRVLFLLSRVMVSAFFLPLFSISLTKRYKRVVPIDSVFISATTIAMDLRFGTVVELVPMPINYF